MPWKKGQSGNPAGRKPKGDALADVLNRVLDEEAPKFAGITKREAMCRVAVDLAIDGNIKALDWVACRIEGRPKAANIEDFTLHEPIRLFTFEEYADSDKTD